MAILLPQNGAPLTLEAYRAGEGFTALERASTQMTPAEVLEEVRRSGLRGRGGAGYPTGLKWVKTVETPGEPRYFCCNAAEGEPGTLKDRLLIRQNPYLMIEGVLLGAYATGARQAYIGIKTRFTEEVKRLEAALAEVETHGYPKKVGVELILVKGPDAYLYGEETAMLEVFEGRTPMPRESPPYPSQKGLFGQPTVVNNVETLANVPLIIRHGAEWFKRIGTPTCPGTMLFSVTGDVERPGVYELPMGTPLRELLEIHAGGVSKGRRLKAVFPGGPSNALLTEESLGVGLDYDALAKANSGLGSGGVIVYDETHCIVSVALRYTRFFKQESCGQCPPCLMGTSNLTVYLEKLEAGRGEPEMLETLALLCEFMKGKGLCTVVDGAAVVVESSLKHFRAEYEAHIQEHGCWRTHRPQN